MYLIVGLGNHEPEYEKTRHNMGFDVINKISKTCNIEVSQSKFKGLFGMGEIKGEKVILLKPQTFMNLSGESIVQIKSFYKIPPNKIIVIYDDMDLEVGIIKLRKKGGPGTHNGMKSVLGKLGTEKIKRVRVGIGKPKKESAIIDYVIKKLSKEEQQVLDESTTKAANAVLEILENGMDIAMNKFN